MGCIEGIVIQCGFRWVDVFVGLGWSLFWDVYTPYEA